MSFEITPVGFLKQYHQEVDVSILPGKNSRGNSFTTSQHQQLVNYLEKGVYVHRSLAVFSDEIKGTNKTLYDSYKTDGVYIWPEYFSFYIEFFQDDYFPPGLLNSAFSQNDQPESLTKFQLQYIQSILFSILGDKTYSHRVQHNNFSYKFLMTKEEYDSIVEGKTTLSLFKPITGKSFI